MNYHLLLYNFFEMQLCYKNIYAETLKITREIFQNRGASSIREVSLPYLITRIFFMKMMTKDEVHLQLGMHPQLGVLRYLQTKVK